MSIQRTIRSSFASYLLLSVLLAFLLVACGAGGPTPFPDQATAARPVTTATATAAPTSTPTPIPPQTYENELAGFTLELPGDWIVEERGVTSLGRYYLLGPEPLGPGPVSSVMFIAQAGDLEPRAAAAQLQCGDNSCADDITFEEIEVGQTAALVTEITGEDTALEWIFLEHDGHLIYFTIHDPNTWQTRLDIVSSLAFVGPTPTPTATATATPTPIPTITIEEIREWRLNEVPEGGIAFQVPDQWEEIRTWRWSPDGQHAWIGFILRETTRDADPADLLPAEGEIAASEPLSLTWGAGISATVGVEHGIERHLILQVGLRTFDFYAHAPSPEALALLHPILLHVIDNVEIRERQVYVAEPVDGAVAWFQALLRDPTGAEAAPYMTGALLETVPANQSPIVLLQLDQRYKVFNLSLDAIGNDRAIMAAELILLDDSVANRVLTLVKDERLGWRIDEVALPEATPPPPTATPEARLLLLLTF